MALHSHSVLLRDRGWVSEEISFTAFIALSLAASEAAFIAFTAAACSSTEGASLTFALLVPRGVMHNPAHSVRQTEWEGRRIACFHRMESCWDASVGADLLF